MDKETERIKKYYPRCNNGPIAATGSVIYCNRLEGITPSLLENFT